MLTFKGLLGGLRRWHSASPVLSSMPAATQRLNADRAQLSVILLTQDSNPLWGD